MKKLLLCVFILGISTSAFAANSLQQGAKGISVGMGDSVFSNNVIPGGGVINNVVNVSGRYFVAGDMAITGGFGLQLDGGDADATYFSISAGFRKYLKVDDFAPFVNGKFTYANVEDDNTNTDVEVIDLEASIGAEYFLNKQFSLEGAIGVGLGEIDNDGDDDTYFGTRTVGVRANFYF